MEEDLYPYAIAIVVILVLSTTKVFNWVMTLLVVAGAAYAGWHLGALLHPTIETSHHYSSPQPVEPRPMEPMEPMEPTDTNTQTVQTVQLLNIEGQGSTSSIPSSQALELLRTSIDRQKAKDRQEVPLRQLQHGYRVVHPPHEATHVFLRSTRQSPNPRGVIGEIRRPVGPREDDDRVTTHQQIRSRLGGRAAPRQQA
jgi:hypothetical protein